MYYYIKVFILISRLYLLGILLLSPSILCTKPLRYTGDEYTYSKPRCNYTSGNI